ncbi:hypothetical protein K435DRAFT_597778, partial [Dendrothele bispora CBS 962.96]
KKAAWEKRYSGLSEHEILEKQTAFWYDPNRQGSEAYYHFNKPTLVVLNGKGMYRFQCIKNPSKVVHRAPYEDSTGNFNKHIKVCDPKKKGNIAEFAAGSTYSAARF